MEPIDEVPDTDMPCLAGDDSDVEDQSGGMHEMVDIQCDAAPKIISLFDALNQLEPAPKPGHAVRKLPDSEITPRYNQTKRAANRRKKRCSNDVIVESSNATGWSAVENRLEETNAHVVCVQEHRTPEHLIDERSKQLFKKGWKSFWSPAIVPEGADPDDLRNASGGVAIFVRKYLGLGPLVVGEKPELLQGRLVAGKISIPGLGSVAIYSAYFHCGAGWNTANVDITEAIKLHTHRHACPWAVAADWNMEPTELLDINLPEVMDACVMSPVNAETCVSPATARTIDYFLVHNELRLGVINVITIEDACTRPHRPVQLSIKAGLRGARKKVFRANARIPIDKIIGPVREPPSFAVPMLLAQEALALLREGDHEAGFRAYDTAFAAWASRAEMAAADASDTPHPAHSSRAVKPERIDVPLVPGLSRDGLKPKLVNTLSCLLQHCQEVSAKVVTAFKPGFSDWSSLRAFLTIKATNCREVGGEQAQSQKLRIAELCDAALRLVDARSTNRNNPMDPDPEFIKFSCSAAAIRKEISTELEKEKSVVKQAKDKAWDEWREKELSTSAKGAHLFSKAPQAWAPPDIYDDMGAKVTNSTDVLKAEAAKYKALWRAGDAPPDRKYEANAPLGKIVVEKVRRTSRSFKRRTGVAPDGWHPRHLALLPDEALEVLIVLYEILEESGHLPSQQGQIYVFSWISRAAAQGQ